MYRDRPWTIRQLAGFGAASDTNRRYRMLLERGATGVNGVFDYPGLRAFDSDDPRAAADVGRGECRRVMEGLAAADLGDVSVVVGGTIPPADAPAFRAMGVGAAFGSGTPLKVIVDEVARLLEGRVWALCTRPTH